MDFYSLAGQMALGTRLRQLGDTLMSDAEKIYAMYGVELDQRWFPVFYMLTTKDDAGVTELANDIGQSHPAVSQVVTGMMKAGIVTSEKCCEDARVSRIALTDKGRQIATRLEIQCADVDTAVGEILATSGSKLWSELDSVAGEIDKTSLYERVRQIRRARERDSIEIVDYEPGYKSAFKDLNIAWIEKHWDVEPSDSKVLDKPDENIIAKGGYIAIALKDGEPIGTCALLRMNDGGMEMAKMAVADSAKGLGIGTLLGEHVIGKAKDMGANRLYLETNSILVPAITLYRKLGFGDVSGNDSPYQRCNVQMDLKL
ncbi:MAG: MarR family transcriptional regulator [Pseudohongiella sp.]|nr:MAG: MarR family transcriptional regulator [Pseudohongiella sp.]